MRREWIEIRKRRNCVKNIGSPSMRREWIEMQSRHLFLFLNVSLPPCGGSGLKLLDHVSGEQFPVSPSMRREWIEISGQILHICHVHGLPPCGGSGLKSFSGTKISPQPCLPPCGGSGLKCDVQIFRLCVVASPSMRREWIEISSSVLALRRYFVSLHAEGVD